MTAGASTIRLPRAIQATLEELLIDGTVVDARASRPLPSVLPAVTSAALPAIVLRQTEHSSIGEAGIIKHSPKLKLHRPIHPVDWQSCSRQ